MQTVHRFTFLHGDHPHQTHPMVVWLRLLETEQVQSPVRELPGCGKVLRGSLCSPGRILANQLHAMTCENSAPFEAEDRRTTVPQR